jgi:hypothetical protein
MNVAGHGLLDRLACADLDASPPQDALGGLGQALVEFGQQARGGVEQQPADRLARQARHLAGQAGGLQLALGGDFGSRVAGADDDEGAAGLALGGIGGGRGQLKLADDVIAEVDGLGDAAEAMRFSCLTAGLLPQIRLVPVSARKIPRLVAADKARMRWSSATGR